MRLSTFIVAGVAALGASVAVAQDVATGTAGLFDWNPHLNVNQTEAGQTVPDVTVRINVASPPSREVAVDVNPGLNVSTSEANAQAPVIDVKLNRTQPAHRR